jgi:hypothetical protein
MANPEKSKSPQPKPVPTPAPAASSLHPPKTMSGFSSTNLSSGSFATTTPPYTTPRPTPRPTYGWDTSAPYGWGSK